MKALVKFLAFAAAIVVIGAGLLWFIFIPKSGDDREQFLQETHLESQLRILVDIQELFFGANGTYASSADTLEATVDWQLHETTNLRITEADSSGWAAWAEVIGREDPVRCHVHVGAVQPAFPEMTEGDPWCPPR